MRPHGLDRARSGVGRPGGHAGIRQREHTNPHLGTNPGADQATMYSNPRQRWGCHFDTPISLESCRSASESPTPAWRLAKAWTRREVLGQAGHRQHRAIRWMPQFLKFRSCSSPAKIAERAGVETHRSIPYRISATNMIKRRIEGAARVSFLCDGLTYSAEYSIT